MVAYTVTIGLIGNEPKIGLDNITNVTLAVEGIEDGTQALVPNDANSLVVSPGDTILWTLNATLSQQWEIQNVPIGKKAGNTRAEGTVDMFPGVSDTPINPIPDNDLIRRIPPNIFDVKFIDFNNTVTIGELQAQESEFKVVSFMYRIDIQSKTAPADYWWIDPEIDICP